jgi:hypothetical protein
MLRKTREVEPLKRLLLIKVALALMILLDLKMLNRP